MSWNLRGTQIPLIAFVFLVLTGSILKWEVECLGTLQVKFISFNNPGGKGDNGHCCDGKWGFCESGGGCDHYFIICIDSFDSRDDGMSKCPLGQQTTSTVHNQASITFGTTIGASTVNPMNFNFTRLQSGVKVKVEVWDDDSGSDDKVGFLKTNPALALSPARSVGVASWRRTTLVSRISLVVEVRAFCDPDWYGNDCGVFCQDSSGPTAYYTCASDGRKLCHTGWSGENCDQNIDDCASNPCQNQGRCEDRVNGFSCHCLNGYEGVNCENNVDECIGVDCHNGMCIDETGSYFCRCEPGYRGETCQEADECFGGPCQNNGTCMNTYDGFNCSCSVGWNGQRCEEDVDECTENPCGNYSLDCENTSGGYSCTCQLGWLGPHCEVEINECQSDPCANNGTCLDQLNGFLCLCSDEWSSVTNCLYPRPLPCDQQSPDRCLNGGTCVEVTAGENQEFTVECRCAPGWTGDSCEVKPVKEINRSSSRCSSESNNPCMNNGVCVSTTDEAGFFCRCSKDWSGRYCEQRDVLLSEQYIDKKVISWSFEGHLTDFDLDNLRAFIVNITAKGFNTGDFSMTTDSSREFDPNEREIEIEHKVRFCDSDNAKSTIYSFWMKVEKFARSSEVYRILDEISEGDFQSLLPEIKFLSSKTKECPHEVKSAPLSSEKNDRPRWPLILGVVVFIVVLASVVLATLYFVKRKRVPEKDLTVSNPIYVQGTEEGSPDPEGEREEVKFTFDRESQQINSALFIIQNQGYDPSTITRAQV